MILTFHDATQSKAGRFGAAYYLADGCELKNVRIQADKAPDVEDAEFDIYLDGVSVMSNHAATYINNGSYAGRMSYSDPTDTTITLALDQNGETESANFAEESIDGGWITCQLIKSGGGLNFTVQLEIEEI